MTSSQASRGRLLHGGRPALFSLAAALLLLLPISDYYPGVSVVQAVKCDACNERCRWDDNICYSERWACHTYGGFTRDWMDSIENICEEDDENIRYDARDLVEDAKDLLVDEGFLGRQELDHVDFLFCEAWRAVTPAHGLTVAGDRVLLDGEYRSRDRNVKDLAVLVAHEMHHVRQYIKWGSDSFDCRYTEELEKGHGFGRENHIEREAYEFSDEVAVRLCKDDDNCSVPPG